MRPLIAAANRFAAAVPSAEPRRLMRLGDREVPMRWSNDGRFIYLCWGSHRSAGIFRVDVATGRKQAWKSLTPDDRGGLVYIFPPVFTPDGKSYAYTYMRMASDLYLVKGLK